MADGDAAPLEVFYSYSHDDEEYRKKLGKHLSVLRRAGLITDWHDREIDAGTAWQEEIDRHLLLADIILHPCGWLRTPLQALQGVPRDNKAISLWPNEHAAFDHVVTEIAKVVDDLRESKKTDREQSSQASAVAIVASTPSPPHPDPLPRAGEGDFAEAAGISRPPAGRTRDSGRVRVGERPASKDGLYIGVDPRELPDLAVFKDLDAPWCSEMVVIPAGSFLMGSPPDEPERLDWEGPQHQVTIGDRFAIGRYAVTFGEYDHFSDVTGREKPADRGWGRGRRPVIKVSWWDAQAYCEWLARETGRPYRLPSEAEWEYACRAGRTTRYAFGNTITPKDANYSESKMGKTTEVGSYPANAWGVYDLHGNVWDWVEDVWHDDYGGAPTDGSAWTDEEGIQSPLVRVDRGGSWSSNSRFCRSAFRGRNGLAFRNHYQGFRVARTLD